MPTRQRIPSSLDVAAAVIESAHDVTRMKLHKLLYYAQAWHLAWYGEPMFLGQIEAWRYGPYLPSVGQVYTGAEDRYEPITEPLQGDPQALDDRRRHVLDSVIQAYDEMDGPGLADLAKTEIPWHRARGDQRPEEEGRGVILETWLRDYFQREAQFGPRELEVEISDETLERVRRGDRRAAIEALEEALQAG